MLLPVQCVLWWPPRHQIVKCPGGFPTPSGQGAGLPWEVALEHLRLRAAGGDRLWGWSVVPRPPWGPGALRPCCHGNWAHAARRGASVGLNGGHQAGRKERKVSMASPCLWGPSSSFQLGNLGLVTGRLGRRRDGGVSPPEKPVSGSPSGAPRTAAGHWTREQGEHRWVWPFPLGTILPLL